MPNGQQRAWDCMNTDESAIESDPNNMEGDGQYGWQGRVFKARNEGTKNQPVPADNTTRGRFLHGPERDDDASPRGEERDPRGRSGHDNSQNYSDYRRDGDRDDGRRDRRDSGGGRDRDGGGGRDRYAPY